MPAQKGWTQSENASTKQLGDHWLRKRYTLGVNLNDLQSFCRVVELGTIAAAAAEQGVPRSTISRRITRLEESLGTELLRRGPRSVVLTEDGAQLHKRTQGALRELDAAEDALKHRSEQPEGPLVISAPDFGRSEAFAGLLCAYRRRHPHIDIDLRIDNRVADLLSEGIDVALRAHSTSIPGHADLVSRTFPLPPRRFFAAPGMPAPAHPKELHDHCLVMHTAAAAHPKTLRHTDGETYQLPAKPSRPFAQANDTLATRSLAEEGLGIALLPDFVGETSVARGSLVPVLPEWSVDVGRIALVWLASRHLAPRIRSFVDLAVPFLEQGWRLPSAAAEG